MRAARYDGYAAWYDDYQAGQMCEVTELAASLVDALLPPGSGLLLDLGCGTGRHHGLLDALGYSVIGADLSTDQLRRARGRGEVCVRSEAGRLPFADHMFRAVATIMTATDFEDLATVLREAHRVVARGGHLVLVMAHPCFGGVFEEGDRETGLTVFPGYREHRWFDEHPLLGDGIRSRVGTMNIPLPALLNSVSDAGWSLEQVEEDARTAAVPLLLGIRARAGEPSPAVS